MLLTVVIVLVLLAAVIDWRTRRIPNLLTLGGAMAGFALQATFYGIEGIQNALSGWAIGSVLFIPGYALRQTGAGDVKLMGATGTFLGPATALLASLCSILVGMIASLALVLYSKGTGPWKRYSNMIRGLFTTGKVVCVAPQPGEVLARSFPYAPAIAAGTLFALWIPRFPETFDVLDVMRQW
jgi:prepilin peptidase CpaA